MSTSYDPETPVSHIPAAARYPAGDQVNVGHWERVASVVGGAVLLGIGLARGGLRGLGAGLLGGALLQRGATGRCSCFRALGINTARKHSPAIGVRARHGYRIEHDLTIARPPEELFRFWRDLRNLPRVMRHLVSVERLDNRRSHWIAQGPLGMTYEWDAEIHIERENELIGWRSIPGGDVDNAGSVHFEPIAGGSGTRLWTSLKYNPPGGRIGANLAALLGEDPEREVRGDLDRFKQQVESGELTLVG